MIRFHTMKTYNIIYETGIEPLTVLCSCSWAGTLIQASQEKDFYEKQKSPC